MRDVLERRADYTGTRGEEEENERKERRKGRKVQVIDWKGCKLTVTGNSFLFYLLFLLFTSLCFQHIALRYKVGFFERIF